MAEFLMACFGKRRARKHILVKKKTSWKKRRPVRMLLKVSDGTAWQTPRQKTDPDESGGRKKNFLSKSPGCENVRNPGFQNCGGC